MANADAAGMRADHWLSDVLGRPAWKVEPNISDPANAVGDVCAIPSFFFTRIPSDDVQRVKRFEDAGFRVVDVTITLETAARPLCMDGRAGARFATSADRMAIVDIASSSFESSRLHLDPLIPKAAADRSRAEWASNFFSGRRGDAMVVAEDAGETAAFLLLIGPAAGVLTIDLIAVRRMSRRLGLGAACIRFAASQVAGTERLRVGTQAANVGSLRFYEALGFRVISSHYVLHLHRN